MVVIFDRQALLKQHGSQKRRALHISPSAYEAGVKPDDHIFSTRFHYKIKRKNGAFERCKVRLVVQGQHMQKKDASGSGDFEDRFSSVSHTSGLCLMLPPHHSA